jgi:hypothetical protein
MPYYPYSLDKIWEEMIMRAAWISTILVGVSLAICLLMGLIDALYRRLVERNNRVHTSRRPREVFVLRDNEMSERLAHRFYDELPISSDRFFSSRIENDVGD